MKSYGTLNLIGPDHPNYDRLPSPRPHWAVHATPDVSIRLKRMFKRATSTRQGFLMLADTPEVCRDLEWMLTRWSMEMADDHRAYLATRATGHAAAEVAVGEIIAGGRPPIEGLIEPARAPRDYQLAAADIVLTTGRLLLADDLGLGKSMSSLLVLRDPEALPALIVCPTHLPKQWLGELHATLPFLTGHILRKGTPYDFTKVRALKGHQPNVMICGYSKLAGWAEHLAGQVRTVIFDEAQELRRPDSAKYRGAGLIADQARFKVGLTATPVYNYGGEVHSIMSILDEDALGTRAEFAQEWGVALGNGHIKITQPKALGTYLRDQGLMLRRTRKDVGRELPDVVRVPHEVDLDEDALQRLSEDVVSLAELITERGGTSVERFRAGGELDYKMRLATGVAKAVYVAAFVKMLLESQSKVVLFGWHHDVYDIWRHELRDYAPVFYTGQESGSQKDRARDAFVDGQSRVLVMSLRSGAGLDGLQEAASVCVFGELDWSPGMHDQCIGRLNRDGQGDPVVAYFLVADQGSDPVIAEVLDLKRQQAEPIRDPTAAVLKQADVDGDRVQRLAASVLANQPKRRTTATPTPTLTGAPS